MTTPDQRLARMRKSFEKDRSVLTADYKYFTTPDAPTMPRVSIPQSKAATSLLFRSDRLDGVISSIAVVGRADVIARWPNRRRTK
jgi:hypothetical protein